VKFSTIFKYAAAVVFAACVIAAFLYKKDTVTVSDTRLTLGTVVEISIVGEDKKSLENALETTFKRISEIEQVTDRYTSDSEISLINRNAKTGPIPISRDMMNMLVLAQKIARLTNGGFDVTVAPIVDLWGFDIGGRLPSPEEISGALKRVDYRNLSIDEKNSTITFAQPGIKIDLNGIAQGYTAAEAEKVLRAHGVESGVINISGDMMIIGRNGRKPWRIGVQDPRNGKKLIAVIKAKDMAIVTSGDYERCFFVDGVRYHHIIDPHTGYPARGCSSVTVVTRDAFLADALCKPVFVLGPDKGMKLVESMPGVDVLIVDDKGKITYSPGLEKYLELVK
jgi:FAD:protein FMN transferase